MMQINMDPVRFKKKPILGILRGIEADIIEPLADTVISAGLETIEITMNTEGAGGLIRNMVKRACKRLTIGAGTVLNMKALKTALDSGAVVGMVPPFAA